MAEGPSCLGQQSYTAQIDMESTENLKVTLYSSLGVEKVVPRLCERRARVI